MQRKDIEWKINVNDCWICTSHGRCNGYPVVCVDGKSITISRLTMEIKIGRKLMTEELVLHSCDNPACINPNHLRVGNRRDNMNDCYERNGRDKKYSNDTVIKVLKMKQDNPKFTDTKIASILGVGRRWVCKVVHKELRQNVNI